MNYHGQNGLLSVNDVPYRTTVAKAFVDAGSQIGLPIIDVNGEKSVGINYIQVTFHHKNIYVNIHIYINKMNTYCFRFTR